MTIRCRVVVVCPIRVRAGPAGRPLPARLGHVMTYTARNVGLPSVAPAARSRAAAAGLWLARIALLLNPLVRPTPAAAAQAGDPDELFKSVVNRALDLIEPPDGQPPQT